MDLSFHRRQFGTHPRGLDLATLLSSAASDATIGTTACVQHRLDATRAPVTVAILRVAIFAGTVARFGSVALPTDFADIAPLASEAV